MSRWRIRASGAPDKLDLDIEADHILPDVARDYPMLVIDELEHDVPVRKREMGKSALKHRLAIEHRTLLRQAFDLIRHDPARQETVTALARALGGSKPATNALLDEARRIIASPEKP